MPRKSRLKSRCLGHVVRNKFALQALVDTLTDKGTKPDFVFPDAGMILPACMDESLSPSGCVATALGAVAIGKEANRPRPYQ